MAWAFALAGGLALVGCDEAEQGRILQYEKGIYLGEPDSQLSEADVDALRARARLQTGS